ncbi:MAG: TonB family protein [bacterium]
MAKSKTQLSLKIEQAGKVSYHRLTRNDRLTIGKNLNNDITIFGDHFPKKHILFSRNNNQFEIRIQNYMKGKVRVGQSQLSFKDMIVHNLLPVKGNSFSYSLTQNKEGYIIIGDAKISFRFVGGGTQDSRELSIPKFKGYSWLYATLKDMCRDIPFKAIVLLFIIFHALMLNYMSKHAKDFKPQVNVSKVPERFAKFIIKSPPTTKEIKKSTTRGVEEEESSPTEKTERSRAEESRGKKAKPEAQGILGLLTGKGSTDHSSSTIDFLLDKRLVRELDQVMSNSKLQVGKGNNSGNDLDNLISLSELGSGIDDILDDINQVESVSFKQKGQIEIEQIGKMRGNHEALGKRTEESVRSLMLSYTGRLTYIYNKYLKRDPELRGKIVTEVVIEASGKVSNVKIVSSTVNNREFELEILNFIRRWQYEPIDKGTVIVTYPLVFNKIGA